MISIYRLVNDIETVCCYISEKSAMYKEAIMGVWEVQIGIVTEAELDIQTGDYLKYNGVNYTLNRDDEFTQKSDVEWVYDLIFEHPLYTLLDKLITNPLTGASTFQLTGKLIDFVDIVVWNTNKTVANPLGIDTGWTRGSVVDTDYKNISFSSVSCRDVLTMLSTEFNVEFLLANKQINYVERIENATGLTFIQGKGNGLYEVTKQNVDKGDTITRIYPVGGNKNVPNANADEQGYLKLPELYLENTSEIKRIVEKRVVFEDIFPYFLGSITSVGGTNSAEIICNDIDFNLTDIAVGSEARVNFLTGDLMGCSFEFQWNNTLKKLTLIEQKDETALADADGNKPTVPSALKKANAGDKFNFTGVIMPATYVNNAISKLRLKATDWLSFYSRKRIKFDVQIDNRWMRGKTDLKAGDLVTIKIPQKNIEVLLRIASLEKNLYTGKITATVSNYLDEKWEKKVEGALSSLQTTVQTGLAGVGNVDILQNNDARPASDNNVMSSLRSRSEFISAKEPDTAAERITFQKGAVVRDLATPDFVQDKFAGAGAAIYEDEQGNTVIEADIMTVRKTAYFSEVQINQIRFQGGIMVYSAANLEVLSVADGGSYLQLNFDTKNGQITNQFVVDDQIRCQQLSGMTMIKYYMSRVTSIGADYIRISKTDIDGTLNTSIGDQVVQFGNRTNTARQSLIEVNVVDGGKQTFYQGVNSYNLIDKNAIEIGRVYDNSEWKTMMRLYGDLFIGDRNLSSYFKYNSTTKQMELAAHVLFKSGETYKEVGAGIADAKTEAVQLAYNDATTKSNSAKDTAISTASTDATNKANAAIQTSKEYSDAKVAVINQSLADLQTQSDGAVSNWPSNTQTEAPTLSNFPANQWTSNTERDRHILDVYTNYQEYVSDAVTPNAGKSWKFVKSEAGVYSWSLIADNNQSKAYLMSVKATAIANQKITTFSAIPNTLMADGFCYRKGDLWSLQAPWNGFTAGELLSASQDSTSFVSSDWTKWVRYTGDEAVNNLQIGGVNLILNSDFSKNLLGITAYPGSTKYLDANNRVEIENIIGTPRAHFTDISINANTTYIFQFERWYSDIEQIVWRGNTNEYVSFSEIKREPISFESGVRIYYSINLPSSDYGFIQIEKNTSNSQFRIRHPKLEKGNKPTDYTEAPEDTQAKITSLDYLKLAIKGSASINGGLVLGNVMAVTDENGNMKAGMSGFDDNIAFWGGGTYQNATDSATNPSAIPVIDRKDGSGHRAKGKLLWDKFGGLMVGAFKIIAGAITGYEGLFERVRITTAAITPLQSLLDAGWETLPDRYRNYSAPSFVINSESTSSQESAIVTISSSISIPAATSLKLYSGGSISYSLANNNGAVWTGTSERFDIEGLGSYTPTPSGTTISIAAGTYNISYVIEVVFDVSANGSSEVSISNSQDAYVEVQSTTPSRTEIGNNGFMSFWTSLTYFFFDKTGGCKGRGAFDIPAGLGGGSINSSGGTAYYWGKVNANDKIVKSGSNYTITHNIGDVDYSLILTPKSTNVPYFLDANRLANSVVITCTGGFDFVLIRTK